MDEKIAKFCEYHGLSMEAREQLTQLIAEARATATGKVPLPPRGNKPPTPPEPPLR